MWVITFKLIDDVVHDFRFSSYSLALDFWRLLLQRDDLIFASRADWIEYHDLPFPEVEHER